MPLFSTLSNLTESLFSTGSSDTASSGKLFTPPVHPPEQEAPRSARVSVSPHVVSILSQIRDADRLAQHLPPAPVPPTPTALFSVRARYQLPTNPKASSVPLRSSTTPTGAAPSVSTSLKDAALRSLTAAPITATVISSPPSSTSSAAPTSSEPAPAASSPAPVSQPPVVPAAQSRYPPNPIKLLSLLTEISLSPELNKIVVTGNPTSILSHISTSVHHTNPSWTHSRPAPAGNISARPGKHRRVYADGIVDDEDDLVGTGMPGLEGVDDMEEIRLRPGIGEARGLLPTPMTNPEYDDFDAFELPDDPPPSLQARLIKEAEIHFKLSSTGIRVFLLSAQWWMQWRSYVNYDADPNAIRGMPVGAIDNSTLLVEPDEDSSQLLPNLIEADTGDYVTVNRHQWDMLYKWYGGGPVLVRHRLLICGQPATILYPFPVVIAGRAVMVSSHWSMFQLKHYAAALSHTAPYSAVLRVSGVSGSRTLLKTEEAKTLEDWGVHAEESITIESANRGGGGYPQGGTTTHPPVGIHHNDRAPVVGVDPRYLETRDDDDDDDDGDGDDDIEEGRGGVTYQNMGGYGVYPPPSAPPAASFRGVLGRMGPTGVRGTRSGGGQKQVHMDGDDYGDDDDDVMERVLRESAREEQERQARTKRLQEEEEERKKKQEVRTPEQIAAEQDQIRRNYEEMQARPQRREALMSDSFDFAVDEVGVSDLSQSGYSNMSDDFDEEDD